MIAITRYVFVNHHHCCYRHIGGGSVTEKVDGREKKVQKVAVLKVKAAEGIVAERREG
jgi:hypothetical protein